MLGAQTKLLHFTLQWIANRAIHGSSHNKIVE